MYRQRQGYGSPLRYVTVSDAVACAAGVSVSDAGVCTADAADDTRATRAEAAL